MFTKKSKKGNIATDNMGSLIMLALVLGVGIYFIWAYVLHGGGDSIKEVQKCGALTGNAGVCREVCDSLTEYDAGSIGCAGTSSQCCINKNEDYDVLTPSGYGSSPDYNFEVTGIRFDFGGVLPTTCQYLSTSTGDNKKINCMPNTEYNIPVIVTVKNIGAKSIDVSAIPFVMINGQTKMARWPEKYATNPQPISGSIDIPATIKITSSEAIDQRYWEIYGYAQCTTTDCKKTDGQSRGILAGNENSPITIRFIRP